MRRYLITCEFHRAKRAIEATNCIGSFADEWEHPMPGVWLVKTTLKASEIRSALLSHLGFQDRLFISEAGSDTAEYNAMPAHGGKVAPVEPPRAKSRILTGIFSRNGQTSRLLKAAIAESSR